MRSGRGGGGSSAAGCRRPRGACPASEEEREGQHALWYCFAAAKCSSRTSASFRRTEQGAHVTLEEIRRGERWSIASREGWRAHGRAAVDDCADRGAVALAVGSDAEEGAERAHGGRVVVEIGRSGRWRRRRRENGDGRVGRSRGRCAALLGCAVCCARVTQASRRWWERATTARRLEALTESTKTTSSTRSCCSIRHSSSHQKCLQGQCAQEVRPWE